MGRIKEFDFSKARRVTPEETAFFRQAFINTFGHPPRGRPPKAPAAKYRPIYIRLHPRALEWARAAAKHRGVGYQTVINDTLLDQARAAPDLLHDAPEKRSKSREFTLEYWKDGDRLVGRLREELGIVGQGKTLGELERDIKAEYAARLKRRRAMSRARRKTLRIP